MYVKKEEPLTVARQRFGTKWNLDRDNYISEESKIQDRICGERMDCVGYSV